MKLKLLLFLSLISIISFGQNESFNYLDKLELNDTGGALIKYNSTTTVVFNKKLKDLDKLDPLYPDYELIEDDIKTIKTKIDNSSTDEYYVVFTFGLSYDHAFIFYKSDNFDSVAFIIPGLKLYIPGNGCVYVSGHTNNYFNVRKKFQLINNELIEVKQPFYYVGLKTKTLKPIKLYDSKEMVNVIASLPEDYSIEVLLSDGDYSTLFLVKTDFGLTGWIDLDYILKKPDKIDKLFFNGD